MSSADGSCYILSIKRRSSVPSGATSVVTSAEVALVFSHFYSIQIETILTYSIPWIDLYRFYSILWQRFLDERETQHPLMGIFYQSHHKCGLFGFLCYAISRAAGIRRYCKSRNIYPFLILTRLSSRSMQEDELTTVSYRQLDGTLRLSHENAVESPISVDYCKKRPSNYYEKETVV